MLQTNPDGTQKIKFVTQYDNGNLSPISVRTSDGTMLYRETIGGVQIEVIKIGDTVTSGYPTGSVKTGLLPEFNSLE